MYYILGFPAAKEKTLKKHGPENFSGPDRKEASGLERKQASDKEYSLEEYTTNVNVGLIKNGAADPSGHDRKTLLVADLMEQLHDQNPRSKGTLRIIVTALGEDLVYRLLGNTKEAYRDGIVSREKMASYFVGMAKNVAAKLGIELGFKTKNGKPFSHGTPPNTSYPVNAIIADLAHLKSGFRARTRNLSVEKSTE